MTTKEPLLRIGRYGLHVIRFPSGRYGFVGTIPTVLCCGPDEKLPVFDTEEAAIAYAASRITLDA